MTNSRIALTAASQITRNGTLGSSRASTIAHPYDDEMRAALALWAEHVAAVVKKVENSTTTPYLCHGDVQEFASGKCDPRDEFSWYK